MWPAQRFLGGDFPGGVFAFAGWWVELDQELVRAGPWPFPRHGEGLGAFGGVALWVAAVPQGGAEGRCHSFRVSPWVSRGNDLQADPGG